MAIRLQPPANDPPINADGSGFSQTWLAHHEDVANFLATIGVGTKTSNNAAAGETGEYITASRVVGSAIALGNFTAIDIAMITLTPGDWDVWGTVIFLAAGTTTINTILAWLNTVSATVPGALETGGYMSIRAAFVTGQPQAIPAGRSRFSIAAPTPVFMSCLAGFGVSTMTGYGAVFARRMR